MHLILIGCARVIFSKTIRNVIHCAVDVLRDIEDGNGQSSCTTMYTLRSTLRKICSKLNLVGSAEEQEEEGCYSCSVHLEVIIRVT